MRKKIQVSSKVKISNTVRKLIVFICVVLIAISSANLLRILTSNEEISTKEEEIYNYKNKLSCDANINLKSNDFVSEGEMKEGQAYLSDLISKIDMNIDYKYIASRETRITYNYKIEAIVKAAYASASKSYDVLNKTEVLKEEKNKTVRANQISIDENVKIDYEKYHTMIKEFKQSMGINADSDLLVVLTVNTKTDVNAQKVENNYVSTYKITLGDKVAVVEDNKEDENEEVITAKSKTSTNKQLDYKGALLYSIILAFAIVSAKFILLDTEELRVIRNEFKLELNRIMKAYGDKIVEVQDMNQIDIDQATQVKDIMQLRKLAEEALVPIYCYIKNDEKAYFIVTKYEKNYIYVLK